MDEAWAAAAVPVTAGLFLLVSLQRGVLQAERRYRAVGGSMVGEAVARLALGVALVAAGLDVTGAYVAMLGSMLATSAWLAWLLRRGLGPAAPREQAPPLRALAAATIVPTVALTALAVLQNVDVIVARHVLPDDLAGAYAAATVAAKALVWVAVGVGMWVLPEAVRRAAERRRRADRAAARVRGRRRGRAPRPADLRAGAGASSCGPRSARSSRRAPTCCSCSASPTGCSPSATWRSSSCSASARAASSRCSPPRRSPSRCCCCSRSDLETFAAIVAGVQATTAAALLRHGAAASTRPASSSATRLTAGISHAQSIAAWTPHAAIPPNAPA